MPPGGSEVCMRYRAFLWLLLFVAVLGASSSAFAAGDILDVGGTAEEIQGSAQTWAFRALIALGVVLVLVGLLRAHEGVVLVAFGILLAAGVVGHVEDIVGGGGAAEGATLSAEMRQEMI